MTTVDRVVVFVVDDEQVRANLAACMKAAVRHGYDVGAVIVGDHSRGWADACAVVAAGKADRILVANRSQMPGPPVVEVATWAYRGGDR
jgi:hypothetical protein